MAATDPIADMLTTIRNGQAVKLMEVSTPSSKVKRAILDVMKEEGYIKGYSEEELRKGVKQLTIQLSYAMGKAAIMELKRISKPGRRVYSNVQSMPRVYNGLGISILSTSKGILPDYKAKQENVAGEVICRLY